jgi:hypothetical protein
VFNRSSINESILLVVEAERLAYFRSIDSPWELFRTIHIARSRPIPRDIEARVELDRNTILLSDAECLGPLSDPNEVHCSSTGAFYGVSVRFTNVPGHEDSVWATLSRKCNGALVVLASGNGDWTQPDTLQGFERMQPNTPAVPAGNVLNFDGPIMALAPNGEDAVARAVVHNLKTGNYEAYLVTATCAH